MNEGKNKEFGEHFVDKPVIKEVSLGMAQAQMKVNHGVKISTLNETSRLLLLLQQQRCQMKSLSVLQLLSLLNASNRLRKASPIDDIALQVLIEQLSKTDRIISQGTQWLKFNCVQP